MYFYRGKITGVLSKSKTLSHVTPSFSNHIEKEYAVNSVLFLVVSHFLHFQLRFYVIDKNEES